MQRDVWRKFTHFCRSEGESDPSTRTSTPSTGVIDDRVSEWQSTGGRCRPFFVLFALNDVTDSTQVVTHPLQQTHVYSSCAGCEAYTRSERHICTEWQSASEQKHVFWCLMTSQIRRTSSRSHVSKRRSTLRGPGVMRTSD